MDKKTTELSMGLYTRLQRYGVPFEDTIETVIIRLCDYFDLHNRIHATAAGVPDAKEAIFSFLSQHNAASFMHDPIQSSLNKERLQIQYLDELNTLVRAKRRAKSPYEIQVDAGEAMTLIEPGTDLYRTSRAVYLPIGQMLMGEYQEHRITAAITANGIECFGKVYDNPSKAAVEAKINLGASDKQAQTNGWTFWKIELPPNSGMWEPLDSLRAAQLRSLENEQI